jgi:molybdenum cofactor biosynthesis protein B
VAIITVSDTRTLETDGSGETITSLLIAGGHEVVGRTVVPDDSARLASTLDERLAADVDAVILNGGTGVSGRDGTVEAVQRCLDRYLSYEEIGAAAILSRAVGGVARGKIVFSLPGSRGAVRLAMEKLIIPELPHLIHELRKET